MSGKAFFLNSLKILLLVLGALFLLGCFFSLKASKVKRVVINEIAWAGTKANPADEWIELKNNTDEEILLEGWKILSESGKICIFLSGKISPKGFYLLERTDDDTIIDIPCNLTYKGALYNSGDILKLIDPEGKVEDTANKDGGSWPAGRGNPDYLSMERVNPLMEDIPSNWQSNNLKKICGTDVKGNPIYGTPASDNSVFTAS